MSQERGGVSRIPEPGRGCGLSRGGVTGVTQRGLEGEVGGGGPPRLRILTPQEEQKGRQTDLRKKTSRNAVSTWTIDRKAEGREQPQSHFKPKGKRPGPVIATSDVYLGERGGCGAFQVRGDPRRQY